MMDVEFLCDDVNISVCRNRVKIIANDIDVDDVVSSIGDRELLDHIGASIAAEHFTAIDLLDSMDFDAISEYVKMREAEWL